MGISRSAYYYKPKERSKFNLYLSDRINEIATEFPSYGYRRITAQLKRDGFCVNHKRILSIMRQENLLVSPRRAYKATTNSNHDMTRYPNLTRNIVLTRTDQLWNAGYHIHKA